MHIKQTSQWLSNTNISQDMWWIIILSWDSLFDILKHDAEAVRFSGSNGISETQVLDKKNTWDTRTVQGGRCYSFDGVDDYVEFDYISQIDQDTAFTISFWLKLNNTTDTQRIIQNIEGSNSRFGVSFSANTLSVWYYDWSTYSQKVSCSFSQTTAKFVCVTHDTDGTMTIKVDDVAQSLWTANPSLTGWSWFKFWDSTGVSLNWKLRWVKIYEWVATEEDQTNLYNNIDIQKTVLMDCNCDEWVGVWSYSKNWIKWEIINATLTTFHTIDSEVKYSDQNTEWYIDNAWLLLYSWADIQHPEQTLAYKANPWYLRTTTGNSSSVFTATTKFVISCWIKVDSEWPNSPFANIAVNMPYWYLYVRGTGQSVQIRIDESTWAKVSIFSLESWNRERNHVLWYADTITRSTKLYINSDMVDEDILTATGTLTLRQDDIFLWYASWTNADLSLADVRIYEVTSTPTDAEALEVYNGTDPVGRTKHHHLTLDGDINDTGVSAETRSEEVSSVFVDVYKEYTGKAPLSLDMVWSYCATFDGADDYVNFGQVENLSSVSEQNIRIRIFPNSITWNQVIRWYNWHTVLTMKEWGILQLEIRGSWWMRYSTQEWNIEALNHSKIDIRVNNIINPLTARVATDADIFIDWVKQVLTYQVIWANTWINSNMWLWAYSSGINHYWWSIYWLEVFDTALSDSQIAWNEWTPVLIAPLCEWAWTTVYDVSWNWNHWTIVNSTESSFRGETQDTYHYNIRYWFRQDADVKIPALLDWTLASDWNTITNPSWNRHNGCETKLKAPQAPSLIQADSENIFFTDWVPNELGYSDILTRNKYHAVSNGATVSSEWRLKLFWNKSYVIWDTYPFNQWTSFTIACKFKFTEFTTANVAWVFWSSFQVWIRVSQSWYLQYTIRWSSFTQMNWGTILLNTEYDYYITYDHTTQKYYFYMDWVLDNTGGTTAPTTFSCDDRQISRYSVRWWTSADAKYEVQRARIYDKYMTEAEILEDRAYIRRMDAGDSLVWQRTGLDYLWDADDVIQADCVVPSSISLADISTRNQKKNIIIYDTPRTASTDPTLNTVQSLLNHT